MRPDRNPAHGLEAIALLAYLYADDDGPVSVDDEKDPTRKAEREALLRICGEGTEVRPLDVNAESALALVSCALDLLDAAECDVPAGTKGAARRIRKAIPLLEYARDRLRPR